MNQILKTALIEIQHNLDRQMEVQGYNDEGDLVPRAVSKVIHPGSIFDLSVFPKSEQAWMQAQECYRDPTPAEMEAYQITN